MNQSKLRFGPWIFEEPTVIAPNTNTKIWYSDVVHPCNHIYSLPKIFQDFRSDGYGYSDGYGWGYLTHSMDLKTNPSMIYIPPVSLARKQGFILR